MMSPYSDYQGKNIRIGWAFPECSFMFQHSVHIYYFTDIWDRPFSFWSWKNSSVLLFFMFLFVLFCQFYCNQFANPKKLCMLFRMQVFQWNNFFYSKFSSEYFFWMLSSTDLIFSDYNYKLLFYFWVVTHQWWAHWSSL